MSYNFAANEARIRQKVTNFIYKYSTVFLSTYSGFLGRIGCPEEYWKLQGFVKVVEYFATSSGYFRLSHRFRGHSGRIFCTFISEGRMFSMLERLDPTAYKRKDYMIASNSFIFQVSNGFQEAVNFLATRSKTRPVFLDQGGIWNSFFFREVFILPRAYFDS